MNLSEEQLSMVEEMAGLFFSPDIIAINLELNEQETEEFCLLIQLNRTERPEVAAYFKGWIQTEIDLRKAIKQSSMNGSSPSQQMMINYKREGKI
jgi:hypothetical protein